MMKEPIMRNVRFSHSPTFTIARNVRFSHSATFTIAYNLSEVGYAELFEPFRNIEGLSIRTETPCNPEDRTVTKVEVNCDDMTLLEGTFISFVKHCFKYPSTDILPTRD